MMMRGYQCAEEDATRCIASQCNERCEITTHYTTSNYLTCLIHRVTSRHISCLKPTDNVYVYVLYAQAFVTGCGTMASPPLKEAIDKVMCAFITIHRERERERWTDRQTVFLVYNPTLFDFLYLDVFSFCERSVSRCLPARH